MIYGYTRPLYNDEDSKKQIALLTNRCEKIYMEEHGSPKKRNQLEDMLMEIQSGDRIIVDRMIALADTSRHLVELLSICEKDEVTIEFLHEGITSDMLLNLRLKEIMLHVLQFQSDSIKQSTTIGINKAKESGKAIGRPKKSDDNIKRAISMYHEGAKLIDIKNETGISKSTLYRYLENVEN